MEFGFLFWLFFAGIVVAVLQDLKRREVDNWLNLFLLVVSFSFIFYRAIFEGDGSIIFQAGFALVLMFGIMNVFYYGRVFAGGDAKLLFAMTVFFVGANFSETLMNVGIFVLFLMVAGSIYGLAYSSVLYVRNFEKVNEEIKKMVDGRWWVAGCGVLVIFFGFLYWIFFVFGIFVLLGLGLYVFAKGLEKVVMIRVVSGGDLREGDWLIEDIKVGKKIIEADWDGLSLENIKLLKGRRNIKIRDGLPFVPAFLIAFLEYAFLKGWVIGLIGFG
ncbi:MAG: prepilin peptidase [archaeon]